ncbi:hypothetical protein [Paenibacillus vini]|uniref:Uncharacterized protein n=1 Tax=Paenibacillus vini TaxID=1476024 RepID=A0ABQ4MCB0_9BACL|nr:hypothetical protein [Paenibacillus vini]MDN4066555.1 hypothetical protein [Paenibacillus vini]GIP53080.1 hypothetical protein J42TS3_21150 [Paenibacillus vini]
MDKIVERYYEVKQQQKELDRELGELRQAILDYCRDQDTTGLDLESHKVTLVLQNRREYDENRLYDALPDLELWRMLSKPDSGKIASLVKLKVISEEKIKDTYTIKNVTLLQVDKK